MPGKKVDEAGGAEGLLGGSWVVVSRFISRIAVVITHIRGLMTPLVTTHEPPSTVGEGEGGFSFGLL